jgi:hypothetical protein
MGLTNKAVASRTVRKAMGHPFWIILIGLIGGDPSARFSQKKRAADAALFDLRRNNSLYEKE